MNIDFGRVFEGVVDRYGDREALVNVEKNRRYSFRQLHLLSNQIANMMHEKLDLRRGDRYLSILENDNLSLLHLWTSFKGEAISVWTNYRNTLSEHERQVALIQPKAVFIEKLLLAQYGDMLREQGVTIVCMDSLVCEEFGALDFWELLKGVSDKCPAVEHDDREDTLLLRFTGGTTGLGKCAEYTLDNWVHSSDVYGLSSDVVLHRDSRFLHITPMSHGSGMQVFSAFLRGACNVTMNLPDLSAWCQNVAKERITTSTMVPTLMYRLLELPDSRQCDLSTIETIFYGAAPIAAEKLKELQQRMGNIFAQVYAATESLGAITYLDRASHNVDSDQEHLKSCGKPSLGVEVMLVNEQGKQVECGEVGELWVRSRSTIRRYFNNPEATAAEFENGFWKSGDIAKMDANGYLYIVDRIKDMIISGGFNVYATEVEAAISSHPDVIMSAVVGIPHDEWGEAVHAEVMLREGADSNEGDLILHVKEKIGGRKSPKTIALVDELPLSAVGKVLRRHVREKYWRDSDRKVS